MQRHQVPRICLSEPDRVFKNCFSHLLLLGLLRCRKEQIKMVIGIQYQRNMDVFSGSVRVQIAQVITKLCIFKGFEYLQSPIKLWQCPIITIHVPLLKLSSHKTLSGALSRITNGCRGPSCGSNYCNSDLLPRHPAAMMLIVVTHSAVTSPILRKSINFFLILVYLSANITHFSKNMFPKLIFCFSFLFNIFVG